MLIYFIPAAWQQCTFVIRPPVTSWFATASGGDQSGEKSFHSCLTIHTSDNESDHEMMINTFIFPKKRQMN